ncbi:hypothetical protein AGDE_00716 [Angomonas deanei]|uniref:tRNA binding domain containing protein, putative n=1 Tax=Angomonas deanei TaxID=59799 RepID=A0A7G2CR40_9TRYP|nr:hypothetical protein AGDE_00716 [Angomonas deanei]CAD2220652.1 Putative tRNA binding domain containing protein, putative [Angomonas deanei]|eukprot:EPY43206.1 hypothetical protein AGDE_00716 [Angomonas deanei]
MSWVCADCEYENEEADATCAACEAPKPVAAPTAEDDEYHQFKVGEILECADVPNAKLKHLKVRVEAETVLDVVTAATNVAVGQRVVIACEGAVVKGETVVKTNVKGVPSRGMVCDSTMLGWAGGGAGAAVVLPDSYAIGTRPPASRPRPQ